jgi:hypothetical protein
MGDGEVKGTIEGNLTKLGSIPKEIDICIMVRMNARHWGGMAKPEVQFLQF